MPEEQLPAWLSAALLAVTTEFRDTDLYEDEPTEVLPGDVCVVRSMNGSPNLGRLFVVTDVEDGCCRGVLAGIETELATEADALLAPSLTGLGYEIAVYTRFPGAVWITQISRRMGAVNEDVLNQLLALAWSDEPDGVIVPRGVPLQAAGIDPRYPALARMSDELDQLTDHCHRRRGDLAAPVFDPAIGRLDVLRAVASEPRSSSVMANAEASQELVDELLTSFPQLGRDEQRALQPVLERALFARPPAYSVGAADEIAGHRCGQALTQVVSRAATHGPTVTVLSHHRCWREAPQQSRRISLEHRPTLVIFLPVNDTDLAEGL